jgi:hypothetical protein
VTIEVPHPHACMLCNLTMPGSYSLGSMDETGRAVDWPPRNSALEDKNGSINADWEVRVSE